MKARLSIVVIVACAAIAISVFTLLRGSRLATEHDSERAQILEATRSRLASADMVALDGSSSEIARAIEQLVVDEQDPQHAEQAASAAHFAHQFLLDRFASNARPGNPVGYREYVAAMQAQGFRPKSLDEFYGFGLEEYYQTLTGKQLTPESDVSQALAEIAVAEDSRTGGLSVPTGVAADPALMAVEVGTFSQAVPGWPTPEGFISEAMMNAPGRANNKTYWRHPEDLQAQLDATGHARVAQVQFVLEFKPGDRRICLFNLVWAPKQRIWMLDSTACTSTSGDKETWIKWQY